MIPFLWSRIVLKSNPQPANTIQLCYYRLYGICECGVMFREGVKQRIEKFKLKVSCN